MANHFLTKSQVTFDTCIDVDGGRALDRYPALHQLLSNKVSPEAAALFAEPLISRGNTEASPTISWYTDLEGEGVLLASLDDEARRPVEGILSRLLREIKPLLDDPDDGRLIAAAFYIASIDNIWVVNGQPLIVNWGMTDTGSNNDPQMRNTHYTNTLGRYLPLGSAPALTADEQKIRQESNDDTVNDDDTDRKDNTTATIATGAAAVAATAALSSNSAKAAEPGIDSTVNQEAPSQNTNERSAPRFFWLPLVLLLVFFSAILIWLLIPGTRLFQSNQANVVTDSNAIAITQDVNRELRERLQKLQAAVAGAQCHADGTLVVPGGLTIEGLLPPIPGNENDAPGTRSEASPQPILTPDPARVNIPTDTANGANVLSQPNLLSVLEQKTAIVVSTANGRLIGSGSGFFVGPDRIVTNFHVINGADKVFVTNETLGTIHETSVIKKMGPFNETGGDFALLKIPGVNHAYYNILQSDNSLKLQSVIAAGYPGDVLATDAQFSALKAGNTSSVPSLTVTDGVVNTEQSLSSTSKVVVHSAPISQGNSGGPLVDMCGRVIGVNTFVRQGNMRNLNFALSTDGLINFLDGTASQINVVSQSCVPQVTRPSPPPEVVAQQGQ